MKFSVNLLGCGLGFFSPFLNLVFNLPEHVTAVDFELLQTQSLHKGEVVSSNCYS